MHAWGNQFTMGSSLSEYFFCEKIVPWPLWDPSTYELSLSAELQCLKHKLKMS